MKIRLTSTDDLPLNKPIKLRLLTIIIRCVISEDGKFYHQLASNTLKQGAFGGTHFRDIYSSINKKWYKIHEKNLFI